MPAMRVWRHPRPVGAQGRCIGAGTDLPVPARRAKRLARRIQALARRERLPHVIWTSPLQRCADVGRWLRRWGWRHHQDPRLLELDFGSWDGKCWRDIAREDIDAWVARFATYAPGGGESLRTLLARVMQFEAPAGTLVVSHGGWMLARRWRAQGRAEPLAAAEWPPAPAYGECWALP
ncbi:MAG: histidine phosphatase family protein [Paucibacter sp.]|nr:histidine phosphatase family protein [Roseateles sp.]